MKKIAEILVFFNVSFFVILLWFIYRDDVSQFINTLSSVGNLTSSSLALVMVVEKWKK